MPVLQKLWFAARTCDKQELTTRKFIEKLRKEENLDVEYFLPTRAMIIQSKHCKKLREVPIVHNLIFIYTTKKTACDIVDVHRAPLSYLCDSSTGCMLVLPNKQMEDFICMVGFDPNGVYITTDLPATGKKVRVLKGNFGDIEGEVLEGFDEDPDEPDKAYVAIRLAGVLKAAIKLPKSHLEVIGIDKQKYPSK